jgi:hypothetical protein
MNPQFVVQIPRGTDTKCHVVVAVTQQYTTGSLVASSMKKKTSRNAFYPIGFAIYEGRPNNGRLSAPFVSENVCIIP